MFKIAVRVICAAAVQAVGNAGRRSSPECHPGFKLMITGQVAFLNDVENLPAVVVPVIRREPFRRRIDHGFQRLPFPGDLKSLFQSFHDRLPVFLLHRPELHWPGIPPFPCVRYIKNVPQPRPVPAGINQGDSL